MKTFSKHECHGVVCMGKIFGSRTKDNHAIESVEDCVIVLICACVFSIVHRPNVLPCSKKSIILIIE
jgi:hypothetical protein